MYSPQLQTYKLFTQAAIANSVRGAWALAASGFVATLPAPAGLQLVLHVYVGQIQRLCRLFPDFGQRIQMLNVVEVPGTLVVYYRMTVTYPAAPTTITFTAVDIVEFTPDGQISKVTVMSDRLATQEAMEQATSSSANPIG